MASSFQSLVGGARTPVRGASGVLPSGKARQLSDWLWPPASASDGPKLAGRS